MWTCCCCPSCNLKNQVCCDCLCKTLCITFEVDPEEEDPVFIGTSSDPGEIVQFGPEVAANKCGCRSTTVEVDYDQEEDSWSTTLVCGDIVVDLLYYFDPNGPGTGTGTNCDIGTGGPYSCCQFKLRSDALGFPEGEEYVWELGNEAGDSVGTGTGTARRDEIVNCLSMDTYLTLDITDVPGSAGTGAGVTNDCQVGTSELDDCTQAVLRTECAVKVSPKKCNNCNCFCESICLKYTRYIDGAECAECDGLLTWDSDLQTYSGTLRCSEEQEKTATLAIDPYSDWGTGTGTGIDANSCVAVLTITTTDIEDEWQLLLECTESWPSPTWTFSTGDPELDYLEITTRCANCEEDCLDLGECPCCYRPSDFVVSPEAVVARTILDFSLSSECGGFTEESEGYLEISEPWSCGVELLVGFSVLDGSVNTDYLRLCCVDGEWKLKVTHFATDSPVTEELDLVYELCPECPGAVGTGTVVEVVDGYFKSETSFLPCSNSGGLVGYIPVVYEIFVTATCNCSI